MKNLVQTAADAATNGNVRALAALIGTPERTIRLWASGSEPPGAAKTLLRLLIERPQIAKWIEPPQSEIIGR